MLAPRQSLAAAALVLALAAAALALVLALAAAGATALADVGARVLELLAVILQLLDELVTYSSVAAGGSWRLEGAGSFIAAADVGALADVLPWVAAWLVGLVAVSGSRYFWCRLFLRIPYV
jgi:hypothetical protein